MIISVSGKIKSGKNEFYNYLHKLMLKDNIKHDEFSFAYIIKIISAQMFGIKYLKSKDREFKEDIYVNLCDFSVHTREHVLSNINKFDYIYDSCAVETFTKDWDTFIKCFLNSDNKPNGVLITMRIWLQFFGTNICRDSINDFWVNSTLQKLDLSKIQICTDMRFPNEAKSVLNKNGILVRIEREACNKNEDEHISETALDNYKNFTYVIHNNGTLDEFHKKIEDFYNEIKVILK